MLSLGTGDEQVPLVDSQAEHDASQRCKKSLLNIMCFIMVTFLIRNECWLKINKNDASQMKISASLIKIKVC